MRHGKRSASVNFQNRAQRNMRLVLAALQPKLQTLLQMHSHLFCVHADTNRDGLLPSSFRAEGSAPNLQSSSVSSARQNRRGEQELSCTNTMKEKGKSGAESGEGF